MLRLPAEASHRLHQPAAVITEAMRSFPALTWGNAWLSRGRRQSAHLVVFCSCLTGIRQPDRMGFGYNLTGATAVRPPLSLSRFLAFCLNSEVRAQSYTTRCGQGLPRKAVYRSVLLAGASKLAKAISGPMGPAQLAACFAPLRKVSSQWCRQVGEWSGTAVSTASQRQVNCA